MKILVTGAYGFVGKNLCAVLKNIKDGKDKSRGVAVEEIYEYDVDTPESVLDEACAIGAVPHPASFERSPLIVPKRSAFERKNPKNPPAADSTLKASVNICEKTCGTRSIELPITIAAITK